MGRNRRLLTEHEKQYIISHYKTKTALNFASELKMPIWMVYRNLRALNSTGEINFKIMERGAEKSKSALKQFKPNKLLCPQANLRRYEMI